MRILQIDKPFLIGILLTVLIGSLLTVLVMGCLLGDILWRLFKSKFSTIQTSQRDDIPMAEK